MWSTYAQSAPAVQQAWLAAQSPLLAAGPPPSSQAAAEAAAMPFLQGVPQTTYPASAPPTGTQFVPALVGGGAGLVPGTTELQQPLVLVVPTGTAVLPAGTPPPIAAGAAAPEPVGVACYYPLPAAPAVTKTVIPEGTGVGDQPRDGYAVHLPTIAEANDYFRRVLYTTDGMQLVAMALGPGEAIGLEFHPDATQMVLAMAGQGELRIGNEFFDLVPGGLAVIPPGVLHDVRNTDPSQALRLAVVYSPPQHPPGEVDVVRPAAPRKGIGAALAAGSPRLRHLFESEAAAEEEERALREAEEEAIAGSLCVPVLSSEAESPVPRPPLRTARTSHSAPAARPRSRRSARSAGRLPASVPIPSSFMPSGISSLRGYP